MPSSVSAFISKERVETADALFQVEATIFSASKFAASISDLQTPKTFLPELEKDSAISSPSGKSFPINKVLAITFIITHNRMTFHSLKKCDIIKKGKKITF